MRLAYFGFITLTMTVAGCGTSEAATPNGNDGPDGGGEVDAQIREQVRQTVEDFLTAEEEPDEEALVARVDAEWAHVPFDLFERAVRERAPITLTAGKSVHKWSITGKERGSYDQYVPEALAGEQRAVPIILFLHGAGGPEGLVDDPGMRSVADALGAVLVVPSCDPNCDWSANETCARQVITLVHHLERVLPADADRVALTGFSMGGRGSFSLGAAYPGPFAAVAPGAGSIGAVYDSTNPADHKPYCCSHMANFAATRLWFWAGTEDVPSVIAQNEACATCLGEVAGAAFRFEKPAGVGHEFRISDWRAAMQWALEKPRERYPTRTSYRLAPQLSSLAEDGIWFQKALRQTPYWAFWSERRDATKSSRIVAVHEGAEITITTENVSRVVVHVPAEWIGTEPLRIRVDGTVAFEERLTADPRVLLHEARERSDRSMTFAARLELEVP